MGSDRWGSDGNFSAALENFQISTEYSRRFLCSYKGDDYNEEKKFDDYEKGLEEIILRSKEKIDIINHTKSEAKQRYVLGNNSYMLLDIKLSNMEFADDNVQVGVVFCFLLLRFG